MLTASVAAPLAIASAAAFGVSDFLGGLASRRAPVLWVTTMTYLAATAVLVALALVLPGSFSGAAAISGAAAGLGALVGFVALYAALVAGPVGVVAPLAALLGSGVPVIAALVLGDRLTLLRWLGVVLAITAAVLLAAPRGGEAMTIGKRALVLTILAGTALGASIVALDTAPAPSGLLPALMEAGLGLILLAPVVLVLHRRGSRGADACAYLRWLDGPRPERFGPIPSGGARKVVLLAASAGALLGAANASLLLALRHGDLGVVAVLSGLYPLATLLAARLVLGERLTRVQLTGAPLALVACALLGS